MVFVRLLALSGLISLIATSFGLAYMETVRAATVDSRVLWALPLCVGAWMAGTVVAVWLGRRTGGVPAGAIRHGLGLLVATLCASAMSHVQPQFTIHSVLEEIPPLFAALFPLIAGLTAILLGRTAAGLDAPDQALLLAIGITTLSGALLLLDPAAALGTSLVALLLAASRNQARPAWPRWVMFPAGVVLLLLVATLLGDDRLSSQPSMTWVATASALALAIAARPRDAADWRRLLAAPLVVAVVVALCDVALTLEFARRLSLGSALETRMVLFRQHPNFLAPFYAFQALVAWGLFRSAGRRLIRLAALAALLLLIFATWHTNSTTGITALLGGLLLLPVLAWMRRLATRPRALRLVLGLVVLPGVLAVAGAFTWMASDPVAAGRALHVERLAKSWDYRIDAWNNSLSVVRQHPWIGVGPGNFLTVNRFRPGSRFAAESEAPHPHNMYLYVAQAGGLLALALALLWIAALVLRLGRVVLAPTDSPASPRAPPGEDAKPASIPPALAAALMAGTLALLAANLLDLGLAVDTVVAWPLFLTTGLLATQVPRRTTPLGPIFELLLVVTIAPLLLTFALKPMWAESLIQRAELLAFMSGQAPDQEQLMGEAQQALARAIALDPTRERAHEHLSRWIGKETDGLLAARDVLHGLIALAPHKGRGHSLLGQLYKRHARFELAADELGLALANLGGGLDANRDRADRIWCLTQIGRKQDAQVLLVEAVRLDRGVIDRLPWKEGADGGRYLPIVADERDLRLSLFDAIEAIYARHRDDQQAGREVGRRFWMDTYSAFRSAGLNARALDVLDYMEAHVPEVEAHSIVNERGRVAEDEGNFEEAIAYYTEAHELTGSNYFANLASAARARSLGQDPGTNHSADTLPVLTSLGDAIAFDFAFAEVFQRRAEALLRMDDSAAAAADFESMLMFTDDILDRARLLLRAGDAWQMAGHFDSAHAAYTRALVHTASKPYPYEMLRTGHIESLPQQIAVGMLLNWRSRGLSQAEIREQSWGLPAMHSPRSGPSLFRMGLTRENGPPDALLREAELLLMTDEHHPLALWNRLFAFEALGRHGDLPLALRHVIEAYPQGSGERLFEVQVAQMRADEALQSDPEAFYTLGMADLLRGRFKESADLFGRGAGLADESLAPESVARLLSWQARALLLSGLEDATPRSKALLQRAASLAPNDALLRLRLGTMP